MFCRANRAESNGLSTTPVRREQPSCGRKFSAAAATTAAAADHVCPGAGCERWARETRRRHGLTSPVCITRGLSQRRRTCLPSSGHLQSLPQHVARDSVLCNGQTCLLVTGLLTSSCSRKRRRSHPLRGKVAHPRTPAAPRVHVTHLSGTTEPPADWHLDRPIMPPGADG